MFCSNCLPRLPTCLSARLPAYLPPSLPTCLPGRLPAYLPLLCCFCRLQHHRRSHFCTQLLTSSVNNSCFHSHVFNSITCSAALGSSRCLSRLSAARTCGLSGIACSACSMSSQMSAWTRTYLIPNLESKSLKLTNETMKQIYN